MPLLDIFSDSTLSDQIQNPTTADDGELQFRVRAL